MQDGRLWVSVLAGVAAGLLTWQTVPNTGLLSSLLALLLASWLIFRMTSLGRILGTLGFLTYPPLAGMVGFSTSYIYLTATGGAGRTAFLGALAAGIVLAAVSIKLSEIWNVA